MMKSIKYSTKKLLFDSIFSRGKKYYDSPETYSAYQKTFTEKRKICVVYYPQKEHTLTKGCIILAHPYLSSAKLFFLEQNYFEIYYKLGFHVITFDFNGFGETKFIDFNFDRDIEDVADWAKTHLDAEILTGHGISFGAAQMIKVSQGMSNKFSRIIIENCLDKSIHYFKMRNKKIYLFLSLLYVFNKKLQRQNDYTKLISTIKNIEKAAFIYCLQDTLTTVEMGQTLMVNCCVPYETFICQGNHLKAIDNYGEYSQFIQTFTKKVD